MNGQLSEGIRDAFASGEFAKAQRLWNEYAGQFQRAVAAGAATQAMLSETRQLIDWCALRVKVHKAHADSQLNQLYLAGRYRFRTPEPQAGVRVCF